ncbi:trichoplein keratin filament-binding protein-like [Crassostrea angulata]|uniref:trichoplein keratin filament-binding protein-like n=1 Tax=Magallana angulata TaxID=2784310 RepID=UPI0022B0EF7E|nr:trichoplein keratin filament-binding protein-like [Crassostrea angulata]
MLCLCFHFFFLQLNMSEHKKQIRFSENDDLSLLKEVLAKNPFKDRTKWSEISDTVSRGSFVVDGRRVRERTNLMLDHHKKSNAESKKKSGVVEEYDEKTALLDDILELKEEEEKVKETEKEKKSADDQKGKDVRKRALENLSKDEEENQTPKKRTSSTNVMEYLQTKVNIENENKREELKLRSEELRLERERFELEREERRERIETEKKEKAFMLQLLEKVLNQK